MRHCFIKFNFFRKIVSIIFSRIANIVDLFLKLVWLNGKLVDFRYSKQAFANVLRGLSQSPTVTLRIELTHYCFLPVSYGNSSLFGSFLMTLGYQLYPT